MINESSFAATKDSFASTKDTLCVYEGSGAATK